MWFISTRLNLSGQLRVQVLLQKAGKVDRQNNDFLTNGSKIKEKGSLFSAGEQELNMNAYEEYKTIIMAKFNIATAVRARQEAVCWDVYRMISMYENVTASVDWYRGYRYRF